MSPKAASPAMVLSGALLGACLLLSGQAGTGGTPDNVLPRQGARFVSLRQASTTEF